MWRHWHRLDIKCIGIQKAPGDSQPKTKTACGTFGLKKAEWQKRGTRFLASPSTRPTKVPSTNFTQRHLRRAAKTTELRESAPSTIRIIMRLSYWTPTATPSRRFSTNRSGRGYRHT